MHKKEQRFNLHTHTARCGHGEGLDIQYVKSAIDAGIELLGFSDHIPFIGVNAPGDRMNYEQKEEYLASIKKLQQDFKGQIEIKVGYEIEYFADRADYLLEMKKDCDYMILGQHLKYIGYEYDCYCSDEDVDIYVQQLEQALAKDIVTYIAHPDYYLLGRRVFDGICIEAAHRIAKASIKYDIPLEVNLKGIDYGKKDYYFDKLNIYESRYPYPFREFWQIISSYGCKVVYGYDAHSPISLLEKKRIIKVNEILKGIPLNYIDKIVLK